MGAFKEQMTEYIDNMEGSDMILSLRLMEEELDEVDKKLDIIEKKCLEMEVNLNLLLPNFPSREVLTIS